MPMTHSEMLKNGRVAIQKMNGHYIDPLIKEIAELCLSKFENQKDPSGNYYKYLVPAQFLRLVIKAWEAVKNGESLSRFFSSVDLNFSTPTLSLDPLSFDDLVQVKTLLGNVDVIAALKKIYAKYSDHLPVTGSLDSGDETFNVLTFNSMGTKGNHTHNEAVTVLGELFYSSCVNFRNPNDDATRSKTQPLINAVKEILCSVNKQRMQYCKKFVETSKAPVTFLQEVHDEEFLNGLEDYDSTTVLEIGEEYSGNTTGQGNKCDVATLVDKNKFEVLDKLLFPLGPRNEASALVVVIRDRVSNKLYVLDHRHEAINSGEMQEQTGKNYDLEIQSILIHLKITAPSICKTLCENGYTHITAGDLNADWSNNKECTGMVGSNMVETESVIEMSNRKFLSGTTEPTCFSALRTCGTKPSSSGQLIADHIVATNVTVSDYEAVDLYQLKTDDVVMFWKCIDQLELEYNESGGNVLTALGKMSELLIGVNHPAVSFFMKIIEQAKKQSSSYQILLKRLSEVMFDRNLLGEIKDDFDSAMFKSEIESLREDIYQASGDSSEAAFSQLINETHKEFDKFKYVHSHSGVDKSDENSKRKIYMEHIRPHVMEALIDPNDPSRIEKIIARLTDERFAPQKKIPFTFNYPTGDSSEIFMATGFSLREFSGYKCTLKVVPRRGSYNDSTVEVVFTSDEELKDFIDRHGVKSNRFKICRDTCYCIPNNETTNETTSDLKSFSQIIDRIYKGQVLKDYINQLKDPVKTLLDEYILGENDNLKRDLEEACKQLFKNVPQLIEGTYNFLEEQINLLGLQKVKEKRSREYGVENKKINSLISKLFKSKESSPLYTQLSDKQCLDEMKSKEFMEEYFRSNLVVQLNSGQVRRVINKYGNVHNSTLSGETSLFTGSGVVPSGGDDGVKNSLSQGRR